MNSFSKLVSRAMWELRALLNVHTWKKRACPTSPFLTAFVHDSLDNGAEISESRSTTGWDVRLLNGIRLVMDQGAYPHVFGRISDAQAPNLLPSRGAAYRLLKAVRRAEKATYENSLARFVQKEKIK